MPSHTIRGMWGAVLLLGADATGHPAPPKTTGDYIFLYVGLGIVLALIVFFAIRAWRDRDIR
jgi:hypothetical protein